MLYNSILLNIDNLEARESDRDKRYGGEWRKPYFNGWVFLFLFFLRDLNGWVTYGD